MFWVGLKMFGMQLTFEILQHLLYLFLKKLTQEVHKNESIGNQRWLTVSMLTLILYRILGFRNQTVYTLLKSSQCWLTMSVLTLLLYRTLSF